MKRLLMLAGGTSGHPLHPPLTDATIGMFTLAAALAIVGALGWVEDAAAKAMWLALLGGLIAAVPTALTGLAEWRRLTSGTPVKRTATLHLVVNVAALVLFALATWFQHPGFQEGDVTTGGLILTIAGFVMLTAGGWLGGTIVFVHGVRVMSQPTKPTADAIKPLQPPLRRAEEGHGDARGDRGPTAVES